ncbi:MAG: protein-L-isoaspartate O-methyltransferase [Mesorhizobium amorphae]|nr:MAG: protein-L-isoaspartate O-methyltransferase [Mesorhizobium amorphae]
MNPDFVGLRTKMVDGQVRTTDVTDTRILDAMGLVPRELFVEPARASLAYIDEDLPLGGGRFLMEPSPFAKLIQLLSLRSSDRVLVVGCATGYSLAVLAGIAGEVIGLESDKALVAKASETVGSLGLANARVVEGPLEKGLPNEAPFDAIFVEGAIETLPDALLAQLADGGRLTTVEGLGNAGVARLYTMADGAAAGRRGFNAAVKPLPGFELRPVFQF